MRRIGRWVWHEPWMAFAATVATFCAMSVVAIRWLAVLGVVRDYEATHTTGSLPSAGGGWGYTASSYHRQLGLISGPSAALTHFDQLTWRIGLVAGMFWMLRLGLRSADHRIGALRGVGVMTGFGLFVVTGVAHRITDAVIPRERARDRVDLLITLWCFMTVVAFVFVIVTVAVGAQTTNASVPGDHAVLAPVGWSIARNALQLGVALGGWSIARFLTRSWITMEERADESAQSVTA